MGHMQDEYMMKACCRCAIQKDSHLVYRAEGKFHLEELAMMFPFYFTLECITHMTLSSVLGVAVENKIAVPENGWL